MLNELCGSLCGFKHGVALLRARSCGSVLLLRLAIPAPIVTPKMTPRRRPAPHHGTPGSPHHQASAAASFFRPSALTAPLQRQPHTPQGEGDSPLLAAGLVTNEATGRHIKVGGGTYKSLVQQGFVLDRTAGVMRSPEPQSDEARGRGSPADAAARRRQSATTRRRSTRAAADGTSPAAPAGSTATSPF